MNKEQIIDYLKYRIDCIQAFLRDMYSINANDILVVKAEAELNILLDVLNVCID